jgi:hypothetical protein
VVVVGKKKRREEKEKREREVEETISKPQTSWLSWSMGKEIKRETHAGVIEYNEIGLRN